MPLFVYRCPTTGHQVQGFSAADLSEDTRTYESVLCSMCKRFHSIACSMPAITSIRRASFRADWGAVDCVVLAVEPNKTLSYTWAAYGLESVVTWTLIPTRTGTRLRIEQSGFLPDQQQAYQGAKYGWQQFFANLEQVLARTD